MLDNVALASLRRQVLVIDEDGGIVDRPQGSGLVRIPTAENSEGRDGEIDPISSRNR